MKIFPLFLSILILSGCTTIHFDNGEDPQGFKPADSWHHNFVLDLYEGSDPVNLERKCYDHEWTSVKTELTFLNGLARLAVNWIAPLWYPKEVETTCSQEKKGSSLAANQ